ncbi:MAG: pilus assembly protein, partial [Rhizobium sp.]
MFGLDMTMLAIVLLVAVAAAAVCYAFLFSRIETEKKADARLSRVKSAETDLNKAKASRDRVQ